MSQSQFSLFSSNEPKLITLPLPDAKVQYLTNFLASAEASDFYQTFCRDLAWHQDNIKIYGKLVKIPRLQAWYGDPQAQYRYSGLDMQPIPWTDELWDLKLRCEHLCQTSFNSVLANWYRDGQDSMGWHADDEPELGNQPVIASVSLGQVRDFDFRHRQSKQKSRISLEHGSLLVMSGDTQSYWQHGISKRKNISSGRINLTFRQIKPLA